MSFTVPIDMAKDLQPLQLDDCQHEDFQAHCNVIRIQHAEDEAPHTFELEVSVICMGCAEVMRFRGAPHEIGFRRPNTDLAATTLSAPMEPSGDFDFTRRDEILAALRKETPQPALRREERP